MDETWDCIVVGGGAAGLSAALTLGRARRRTLVVDAGDQSNLPAHGIGGLLGHDGRPPSDLYAAGRAELAAYPSVELRRGEVVDGERDGDGFALRLADGGSETARRVVLATGMDYRPPDLPGVAERWGRSVFHCPFCHGWELRERPLAVYGEGARGVHGALLLRAWSDEVTLLTGGPAELDAETRERLRAAGVAVEERPVRQLRGPGEDLTAIVLDDGSELPCGGLLMATTLHQRSPLAARLGAATADAGPVVADAVEAGPMGATSVPGLFAAGDVGAQMPSVPQRDRGRNTRRRGGRGLADGRRLAAPRASPATGT